MSGTQAHHAIHVMRLAAGDEVTLFNGAGVEYAAHVGRIERAELVLRVHAQHAISRESPLAVVVAQGISGGERMDYTVQKCVELGAAAVQPLTMQRSVVRLAAERAARRVAHWQGVAASACEQCGRNVVPPVRPVATLMNWLGEINESGESAHADGGTRLVLTPGATTRLRDLGRPQHTVTLLAGPEGGFADEELAAICSAGFTPLALGPRILRTETAAAAALAALQALWGDT